MGIGTRGQKGSVSRQESLENDIAGFYCARLLPQCKIAAIGSYRNQWAKHIYTCSYGRRIYQEGRCDLSRR